MIDLKWYVQGICLGERWITVSSAVLIRYDDWLARYRRTKSSYVCMSLIQNIKLHHPFIKSMFCFILWIWKFLWLIPCYTDFKSSIIYCLFLSQPFFGRWSDMFLNIWNCCLPKGDLQLCSPTVNNMHWNWQRIAVCLHNLDFWLHHIHTANPAFKCSFVALSVCMWEHMCKAFLRQCGHVDK